MKFVSLDQALTVRLARLMFKFEGASEEDAPKIRREIRRAQTALKRRAKRMQPQPRTRQDDREDFIA